MDTKSVNAEFEKTKNKLLEIKKILKSESELIQEAKDVYTNLCDAEKVKVLERRLDLLDFFMSRTLDRDKYDFIFDSVTHSEIAVKGSITKLSKIPIV